MKYSIRGRQLQRLKKMKKFYFTLDLRGGNRYNIWGVFTISTKVGYNDASLSDAIKRSRSSGQKTRKKWLARDERMSTGSF